MSANCLRWESTKPGGQRVAIMMALNRDHVHRFIILFLTNPWIEIYYSKFPRDINQLMDKTCKRRQRPDIGKHNGRVSGCEVQSSPNKTAYTMANRRGGRHRNEKIAALGMASAFHLSRGRDKANPSKNGEQKHLVDKMALLKSQRRSDGAIQGLSKPLMPDYPIGESSKMIQSLEADTKRSFDLKSYQRHKPKIDFVTFHKTVDANFKKMEAAGYHNSADLFTTIKTRNAAKLSDRSELRRKQSLYNFAQSGDKNVVGHESEVTTKNTRLPTPMPNSLEPRLANRVSELLHKKTDVVAPTKTNFTVNPVVVEMQNKTYKRTEHKIVLKDFGKREHMKDDISWFKRLLPEEYFIKPNLKKTILPYKDSPYERTNRQVVVETVTVKPSKQEKTKEKKIPIKVTEDRLGVGGVNIDDLRPSTRLTEEIKKEQEQPRLASPKHIELKSMKLPRLPFERIKKQGKGYLSMIESSDDSIRTKEVPSRPSSRRFSYEKTTYASRKTLLEDLKKDRSKRDEDCRRNFNKFMSITHNSKTQDELLKSQDPKSLGRREGLNVLFQKQAEKATDESLLHKWQRLGRKFFPEALTEELRYRKQQNRLFSEYLNNSNDKAKHHRHSQPNVCKKPDTSGTVVTIQMRQPTITQQPKTDMDKILIAKGLDKALDNLEKQSDGCSLPSTEKNLAETVDTNEKSSSKVTDFDGHSMTTPTETSYVSEDTTGKKEHFVEKVKQHQGQMAPGKTEAAHVGKDDAQAINNAVKEVPTPIKSKQKKISKRGKIKNGKRVTETKLKAMGDLSKTTASSNIFETNLSADGPLETSLNTLDELSWSLKNYIPTNTMTNAYWVQTKHNVPQSLLDYTQQAILKSSGSKDTTNLSSTEKSDAFVDEWGQYGRTASETDKLLATLTERIKTRMNSPGKKAPKLKNPRGIIQLQPEHSSTVVSGVDTLNTLRSISLSGLDTEKFMYSGSRKVTSEISVRKTKVSSKRTSSGRMEERFPKEVEPVRPVLLPSVRAKKFSQSKLYVSGQQQNTDGDSTTCLSSSLPTLSFITQHVQQSPPDFKQEHSREEEGKTEMSEKCCLSRTPMTSSIEITGVPNEIPKPSINRIEQFLQKTSLEAGRNESSLIHIHKTTAVMNVHHNERDPSAESFLDSSTAGSISICDYLQGEQLRTNMRDGVGHRFFRKPPPVVTELIEIKSECPPVVCERSISDILPHAAPAKMNILQHGDRSASVRQSSQSPTRKENLEAGDSVTVEDSVTQLAETESLAAMSSTQTEKLSDTSTTSTTSSSQSESTNETQTEPEAEESSEKPAAAPEVIVQTAVVEVKGEKTDVSCSQVEPSEKSALKTEQVDVSVSVQSLGSIPPLSPSDVMIGGSPRKNRSLSDVRRGASPQNRRNAPQEGVGYSFFRGEFDPPVRKPKIDSCVQTEKYQRPKKQCTMTSVDVVD
ncbi:uncharacterized protein LOC106669566 isoform X4 [Cimex lectularius]|uniref:Uncharacterized protein n=1 Tax=Cimex lectularius TaxID=79782 RepID=A0A8I6RZQ9_CIMLE|nr:uncharacterized protein LOC106669566 isoform X4 [Cimex lectularius]